MIRAVLFKLQNIEVIALSLLVVKLEHKVVKENVPAFDLI
jgi:hypothetical protein